MNNFDELIDELLEEMDKQNIPKELQIKYLKELNQIVNINKTDEILCAMTIGTFVSGSGVGIMSMANNEKEAIISSILFFLGISICFIGRYKSIKLDKKELEEIEKITQQIKTYTKK